MNFSFSNLSLAGITAAAGVSVLAPGRYTCKVADVELADTKSGTGKILKVKLRCDAGVITDNINVANANPKAVEIGLEQLKSLLVNGGHQDPDNIGEHGLASIKGLTVGVLVAADSYNGLPSSKVRGYYDPNKEPAKAAVAPVTAIGKADTDLPF